MSVPELIAKAKGANPPNRGGRSRYEHLVPVVEALRDNGFTLADAVRWLIQEGKIPAKKESSAYRSIRQKFHRDAKREAKQKTIQLAESKQRHDHEPKAHSSPSTGDR